MKTLLPNATRRPGSLLLAAILATACATAPPRAADQPETPAAGPAAGGPGAAARAAPEPDLPPIPPADGPLELRVSYPRDSAFVATRGRNFIFGSAGTGDARVWINDQEVEVQPNGGFLAFLPVPDDGVYRLRARADGQSADLEVPVRLPEPPPAPRDSAVIVAGSLFPAGGWAALPGEHIEVGFQAAPGGTARLLLPDGDIIPLVERRTSAAGGATDFGVSPGADGEPAQGPPLSWYEGFFTARPLQSPDTTTPWPVLGGTRPAPPTPPGEETPLGRAVDERPVEPQPRSSGTAASGGAAVVELRMRGDILRQPLPLNLVLLDASRPRVGVAYDPDPPEQNGDGAIIARPGPGGGPYHYTWANGAELTLTGERGGIFRVRLAEDLDVWSPADDIRLMPSGTPPPRSRVATVRMDPQPEHIDVHVALDRRLPYQVDETENSLQLTVFGALSRANFLQHGRTDPYIVRGEWSQPTNDRFAITVHTNGAPWGYETFWADGDDLVLRIRRPPAIDSDRPFEGLGVGIDAGHGGADRATMGPTGLTEADANLAIARALRSLLEARGARVVMSRTSDTTLTLVERTELARRNDVDLWLSVHNNAFPDGVDPWDNNGTSVYYNHPRAASLAWSVQKELLAELGLRDLGVGRADLHQARFTWAPAILTETMFMMIPRQEAALKRDSVQQRIAEAHARGLEAWLRSYAAARDR